MLETLATRRHSGRSVFVELGKQGGDGMKRTMIRILALAVVLLCAAPVYAFQSRFTPVEGDFAKKVDTYNYFVDYSGSIMMSHKTLKAEKITMIKQVLTDINALLPALDYDAGLYTFAPYGQIIGNGLWDRKGMQSGIEDLHINLDIFARTTDLGDGFIAQSKVIATERGKKALIIFSDGEINRGPNPVIEARDLLEANPDLCLHFVSVADTEQGQAMLDAMARLKPCSVSAKAWELLEDENAMRQFVSDIFYEEKLEEVIVLRGVNFAFDSSELDPTAQSILNEVAVAIQQHPHARVLLSGYTDAFGTDKYNLALSQRRADAVLRYLTQRGIDARRLIARGMGKSYTYDNSTPEGCYMNRRVEVTFIE